MEQHRRNFRGGGMYHHYYGIYLREAQTGRGAQGIEGAMGLRSNPVGHGEAGAGAIAEPRKARFFCPQGLPYCFCATYFIDM
jgi:hypothetical protein